MKKEITLITKSHLQTVNLGVILTIYSLPSTMEQPLTFVLYMVDPGLTYVLFV